eukprot:374431-Pyramimonas_sp.AAC.1
MGRGPAQRCTRQTSVLRRAGWAVVSVTESGLVVGAAYGPLPHVVQLAGAREAHAFRMALRLVGPQGLEIVAGCRMEEDVWGPGPEQNLEDIA